MSFRSEGSRGKYDAGYLTVALIIPTGMYGIANWFRLPACLNVP